MNLKLEVIRINEDVIATSAYTCETSPAHVKINELNAYNGMHDVDPYSTSGGKITGGGSAGTQAFAELLQKNYIIEHNLCYYVDMDNAVEGKLYYFTGSGWAECPNDFANHIPD